MIGCMILQKIVGDKDMNVTYKICRQHDSVVAIMTAAVATHVAIDQ